MFRRYFFPILAGIAIVFSTSLFAVAQSGQLRGHVTLKKADGTVIPAGDAVIDIFRTDLASEFHLKANKRGEFIHAGLPFAGDYIIGVSLPGAQPTYLPGVKVGRDIDYALEMQPGDGSRLTLDQINKMKAGSGSSSTGGSKESAEDRAKRTELLKKNEEITASNKKAAESNEIVERTFKTGNEALKAKNYDAAIAAFNEGLAADPEHPGAPALLTNKTMALNARAVDRYNTAVKSADETAKNTGIEDAKKDWREASASGAKAVTMLKALPAPPDAAAANNAKTNMYFALFARADAMRLFVPKVDPTQADAGVTAYEEYIAVETDPAKKSKAEHDLAQMLFDANAFDQAQVRYQKILEANPDDLNALLRLGQILFNIGAMNNGDKAKYQEASNYLAKYVEKAPDGDPFKADAKAILDTLKDQANVKPEKLPTAPRRTRRP
jgi:tetratricopeptide (TPR) repeat protein